MDLFPLPGGTGKGVETRKVNSGRAVSTPQKMGVNRRPKRRQPVTKCRLCCLDHTVCVVGSQAWQGTKPGCRSPLSKGCDVDNPTPKTPVPVQNFPPICCVLVFSLHQASKPNPTESAETGVPSQQYRYKPPRSALQAMLLKFSATS